MSAVVEHERVVAPVVSPREVLHRAADLLEEFGWCQGKYACDRQGDCVEIRDSSAVAFCMAGAVKRAARDLGLGGTPYWDFLPDSYSDNIPNWNDKPGRTKVEVVARLRHAAEKAG